MVAGKMDDLTTFRDKLISLVDLLPGESAQLMEHRPRFAHAVLVLADQALPGELLKANYVKQLDPYWIQTKGAAICNTPSQAIQLCNQERPILQTSSQDTQTTPFQWFSNDEKAVGAGQKTASSETSGICSGGEDISQSPPPPPSKEVPIELKSAINPATSKAGEMHGKNRNVTVIKKEGAGLLGRAVDRREAARGPLINVVEIEREEVAALRPLAGEDLVHRETHVRREKITRYHSDTEDYLPQHKAVSCTRHRSPAKIPDDPIIREAIRILETSCHLLEETADRIATLNVENQRRPVRGTKESLSFRFPSEIRRKQGQRSSAESPSKPFATSTTTTTTKLIKETLTTTNY